MTKEKRFETILYSTENKIARIYLNRPEVHNAFNEVMIAELTEVFKKISEDGGVRVVVLTGNGKSFSAGADLNWMKKMINFSYEQNLEDSLKLAELFYLMYSLPKPVIARVNGAAIGGGTGLVAVCDIAIAAENAKFSLSEVKLGLVPACISPYVIRKVGEGRCREFFLTGERLIAKRALELGLVNQVVPLEELDQAVQEKANHLISSGPKAIAMCKELLKNVPGMSFEKAKTYTADMIASMRIGDEGQEGMNAFLEKRRPNWSE
ncbi:MAG: enoyl-CoA hydratase/isomerase family protein [candidate division Zixibacteria bacterium]|nr:enoyl-CoA hydratase/isomerase family protein [candidate division Zixibacteria bacterium]